MLGKDTGAAQEVIELWNEYEAGSSPVALLVKDFDKLEMIIQVSVLLVHLQAQM